jgi:hypothetical protein
MKKVAKISPQSRQGRYSRLGWNKQLLHGLNASQSVLDVQNLVQGFLDV